MLKHIDTERIAREREQWLREQVAKSGLSAEALAKLFMIEESARLVYRDWATVLQVEFRLVPRRA